MADARLPNSARFVVVGAGIHGLSTAWHLSLELQATGRGDGTDVIVIEKTRVGAGASGIACGVIRNNYFQPAMRELMAHSVDIWESDPPAFGYHPVGYLQISHEGMRADVASVYEQQRAIGYDSTFVEGARETRSYMKGIFHDWRARGVTSVLHEHRGGYANAMTSLRGLAAKAGAEGVRIVEGVEVTGFVISGGAVDAVETTQGTVSCDQVIIAPGPWIQPFWSMLDLPQETEVANPDGSTSTVPSWTYWVLQEGTLAVDPGYLLSNDGQLPPVVHIDTDAPLYDDEGRLLTDQPWGIYYKPDFSFGGVQGGYMPYVVDKPAEKVAVDPYGPASPDFVVDDGFRHIWAAGLSHCQERFEGLAYLMDKGASGGLGSFSPDRFPIFDSFYENAYVIADSNHGYKMIGVGALVAKEVLGSSQTLLAPFRYSRFAAGKLHPESNSPYPWS